MAATKASKKKRATKAGARTKMRTFKQEPVGRPRTQLKDLPRNWKALMRDAAREGGGPTRFMVVLKIGNSALTTLLEDSAEFRDIYSECRLLCQDWWETTGRELASGARTGSAPVWSLNMTNRFDWRSGRQEVVGDPTAPLETRSQEPLTKEGLAAELEKRGLPSSILRG